MILYIIMQMTFLIMKYSLNLSKYIITQQRTIFYYSKYLQEEDKGGSNVLVYTICHITKMIMYYVNYKNGVE